MFLEISVSYRFYIYILVCVRLVGVVADKLRAVRPDGSEHLRGKFAVVFHELVLKMSVLRQMVAALLYCGHSLFKFLLCPAEKVLGDTRLGAASHPVRSIVTVGRIEVIGRMTSIFKLFHGNGRLLYCVVHAAGYRTTQDGAVIDNVPERRYTPVVS